MIMYLLYEASTSGCVKVAQTYRNVGICDACVCVSLYVFCLCVFVYVMCDYTGVMCL